MKNKSHHLIEVARHLLTLVEQEKNDQRLRQLAEVTLDLKPLLDELPTYPDLGLELHEYAVMEILGFI